MNGWLLLVIGIIFEVAGTYSLKLSNGFSHMFATICCFTFFAIAISFVILSARTLDVSMVYAVWSGIGVVLVTIMGTLFFSEHMSLLKGLFIVLILIGVVGLHQTDTKQKEQAHVYSVK